MRGEREERRESGMYERKRKRSGEREGGMCVGSLEEH